jgi:hypothetical protein
LTLLVRARAPPETWTTRLKPHGQPEHALVNHLFGLVTIFGNDCSKLEQSTKSLILPLEVALGLAKANCGIGGDVTPLASAYFTPRREI